MFYSGLSLVLTFTTMDSICSAHRSMLKEYDMGVHVEMICNL